MLDSLNCVAKEMKNEHLNYSRSRGQEPNLAPGVEKPGDKADIKRPGSVHRQYETFCIIK